MSKTIQIALVIFLFAITDGRRAAMAADPAAGCGQFVQKFYDWYVAREKALNKAKSRKDVMEVAMKEKRSCFSPELLAALQEDVAAAHKAQAKLSDWILIRFSPRRKNRRNMKSARCAPRATLRLCASTHPPSP